MRAVWIVLVLVGALLIAAAPARASCIQQTQADQLARADAVAYGRVTNVDRGAGTVAFRPITVYRGALGSDRITVRVGPGGNAVSSVDYRADEGDHLLYLRRQGSSYETTECSGSHPGPATADELRLLSPPGATPITYPDPGPDLLDRLTVPLVGAILAAGAGALLLYRRRARAA